MIYTNKYTTVANLYIPQEDATSSHYTTSHMDITNDIQQHITDTHNFIFTDDLNALVFIHLNALVFIHMNALVFIHLNALVFIHLNALVFIHLNTLVFIHLNTLVFIHLNALVFIHLNTLVFIHLNTLVFIHLNALVFIHVFIHDHRRSTICNSNSNSNHMTLNTDIHSYLHELGTQDTPTNTHCHQTFHYKKTWSTKHSLSLTLPIHHFQILPIKTLIH